MKNRPQGVLSLQDPATSFAATMVGNFGAPLPNAFADDPFERPLVHHKESHRLVFVNSLTAIMSDSVVDTVSGFSPTSETCVLKSS